MLTKKPMVLVLAGPNGSGKSTITHYFDIVGEYTNADDVVASTGMDNVEAAIFVDKKRYKAIDEEKIKSRYYKSLSNIRELIELCDILHVYDNTVEPVRIIRKHKEDFSIFPNDIWDEDRILGLIK